jgi:hypothetical protein
LGRDRSDIVREGCFIEKSSFAFFASWIADHARRTTYDEDQFVSSFHPLHRMHKSHKIPQVK